jgi:hypothetical protein
MRPRKGICRGCLKVANVDTLDERRRCAKCAPLPITRECRRCGEAKPETDFASPECIECIDEPRAATRGTWSTSDGWRRVPCLKCAVPFWSDGKEQRMCEECRVIVIAALEIMLDPYDFYEEGHPTCCLRCGINISFSLFCEDCDAEVIGYPATYYVGDEDDFALQLAHQLLPYDERNDEP